jgi:hypothetical protein
LELIEISKYQHKGKASGSRINRILPLLCSDLSPDSTQQANLVIIKHSQSD